jgi:catechol 2,3-dioxygenase-like lactoylglutathione lyase family enzyme
MRARLRYLAIVSERPAVLGDFYEKHMGMKVRGRNPEGEMSLTDGFFNLTVLKARGAPGEKKGLSHWGIDVDDIGELRSRLAKHAPSSKLEKVDGDDGFHGEYTTTDTNGLRVSVSTKHFGITGDEVRLPRSIRHIVMSVPKGDQVLDFYRNVFGFRELRLSLVYKKNKNPAYLAGDGSCNMTILPAPEVFTDIDRKFGFNHFGFLVPDLDELLVSLPEGSKPDKRPPRPMAEHRAYDPDGNPFDLSKELGYEVDFDVWARVPPASAFPPSGN